MGIEAEAFGNYRDKRVDQFRLRSNTGVEVDLIGWGVSVRDWRVPVAGGLRSVVLGFETFDPYVTDSPHFGSLAGRVANRIAGAEVTVGGRSHKLVANEGPNTLHGGPDGLGRVVWAGEPDTTANAVRFTYRSPDGEMGFPGTVDFAATYSLAGNRLKLLLEAVSDAETPINLVQHQYFNLGGDTVLDHRVQIDSSAYTALDKSLIPTGAILPSAGTQFDFRTARTLRDASGKPLDCDVNLVLDTGRDPTRPVATVVSPAGDLTLRLWTDQPGLQLYNGVYTDVAASGLGGRRYGQYSGLCLEDQKFADAVHHPHFPSTWQGPGNDYRHVCEIEIG